MKRIIACSAMSLTGFCSAQIDPVDVVLQTDSGAIETFAQPSAGVLAADCVFAANISTGSTNDPGFDTFNGAFAANQNVYLDLLSHLRRWNGAAWVPAAPVQIRVTRGFDGPVFSPVEGTGPALGFPVAANAEGKWHKHFLFTLVGDAQDGVYALELGLRTAQGTPADSPPFWFVFSRNASQQLYADALDAARTDLSVCGAACIGDIADDFGTLNNADGQVSFGDFLALLGLVGPCPGGTPGCIGDIADDFGTINGGDGQVSFGDFLALLGLVGSCD